MRFAAIADIHGNCAALEAVLADIAAQGIATDSIVNLGDCLSGPLEAGRTADMLLPLGLGLAQRPHVSAGQLLHVFFNLVGPQVLRQQSRAFALPLLVQPLHGHAA